MAGLFEDRAILTIWHYTKIIDTRTLATAHLNMRLKFTYRYFTYSVGAVELALASTSRSCRYQWYLGTRWWAVPEKITSILVLKTKIQFCFHLRVCCKFRNSQCHLD